MTVRHTSLKVVKTIEKSLNENQQIFEEGNYETRQEALQRIADVEKHFLAHNPNKQLKVIKRGGQDPMFLIIVQTL